MGLNLNGTADVPKLVEKIWSTIWGVFVAFLIEIIAVVYFNHTIINSSWVYVGLLLIMLLPTTFLLWAIATKRWFQRSTYWTLLAFIAVLATGVLFYSVLYPLWIERTKYDLPFVQWWGSGLTIILIGIVSYLCFFRFESHKKLCIVFLVSNRSTHEHELRSH